MFTTETTTYAPRHRWVLSTDRSLSPETREALAEQLAADLADPSKPIVLGEGMTLALVGQTTPDFHGELAEAIEIEPDRVMPLAGWIAAVIVGPAAFILGLAWPW